MPRSFRRLLLLGLLVGAFGRQAKAIEPGSNAEDHDSATLRRRALAEWYGESSTAWRGRGGPWSQEFRAFMLEAAKRERLRWADQLPGAGRAIIEGSTWINLGPTEGRKRSGGTTVNISDAGRIRTILADGTRLYIATAAGGAWRRENDTWTPLTESLGTLSCGSLAMDPLDHEILYLGLGDPWDGTGIGIVRTPDGGRTWSDPVLLGDSRVITKMVATPHVVLAATDTGLFRSTDRAASFAAVVIPTGREGPPYIWSIAQTGEHSFVLALEALHDAETGPTDGQVYTSDDDGVSWTRATGFVGTVDIGRVTLAAAPLDSHIVYAMAAISNSTASRDMADIFKSTDGGRSWTALSAADKPYTNNNEESSSVGDLLNGQGWYNQLVLVDPANPDVAYFGGALLLTRTTDGGVTFSQVSNWLGQYDLPYVHADFHAGTFDGDGRLYIGNDGGLFVSTDNAVTFSDRLNVGITTHLLYSVSSSSARREAVLGGMQDNGTRLREGTSSVFRQVIGGDGFGSNIHRTDARFMLGSLYNLAIRKSVDGGSAWAGATSGISEAGDETNAPFITRIVAWEGPGSTGNEVYTFSNSRVYRSTNYASSWSAIGTVTTTGSLRNLGVAAGHSEIVGAVASSGRVFLSNNGGTSFSTVASGASPAPTALPGCKLSLSSIHFDVSDPNIVYVASIAPDSSATHLWKSTDFGAHWNAIDGNGLPQGVPVNIIKSDPNPDPGAPGKVLYAGTDFGVYRSTDGGASWSRFGAGMPLVNVWDLYISSDGSLVRAASYGRGFWELTNLPPPAPNRDFAIDAEPALLQMAPGGSDHGAIHTQVTLGSPQTIGLSVAGLPTGATAMFEPATIRAGADSTLTVMADAMTPPGTYPLTVTAAGETASRTKMISLHVIGNSSGSGGGVDSGGCGCAVGASAPAAPVGWLLVLALACLCRRRN